MNEKQIIELMYEKVKASPHYFDEFVLNLDVSGITNDKELGKYISGEVLRLKRENNFRRKTGEDKMYMIVLRMKRMPHFDSYEIRTTISQLEKVVTAQELNRVISREVTLMKKHAHEIDNDVNNRYGSLRDDFDFSYSMESDIEPEVLDDALEDAHEVTQDDSKALEGSDEQIPSDDAKDATMVAQDVHDAVIAERDAVLDELNKFRESVHGENRQRAETELMDFVIEEMTVKGFSSAQVDYFMETISNVKAYISDDGKYDNKTFISIRDQIKQFEVISPIKQYVDFVDPSFGNGSVRRPQPVTNTERGRKLYHQINDGKTKGGRN